MYTPYLNISVCIAGAPRSIHRAEVHQSLVSNLILPFCHGMCDRIDMNVLLKDETFSRSMALKGITYDVPRKEAVDTALKFFGTHTTSLHVKRWPSRTYVPPSRCTWNGTCSYEKKLARAHVQSVIGQMHSWYWCAKHATNHDWLIISRPDVLFRSKFSSYTKWTRNVSMSDEDPRERVIVVHKTRILDLMRGWKRWRACTSVYPDLGCETQPETILQREASAIRISSIRFGNPTFVREYDGRMFTEY
jgi:hypothetical protein